MSSIPDISGVNGGAFGPMLPKNSTQVQNDTFGTTLNGFLKDVNSMIQEAGDTVQKMATGEVDDIHEVIVAAEKASVGLELVMEVRNRLMDSYQEIMRMQI